MSTSIRQAGLSDRVPSDLRVPGSTIVDVFWDRVRSGGSRPALRWSTAAGWQEITWAGYGQAVAEVALALRELGLRAGDRVGILAGNCPEWHIADLAILASRMVSVPVYATNAASQAAFVLHHSGARACFVEDNDQLAKVLLHRGELTALEHVVVVEQVEPLDDGFTQPLSQMRAIGASRREHEPDAFGQMVDAVSPSDLATIVYTSGTTGPPKGAMVTHANIMWTIRSARLPVPDRRGRAALVVPPAEPHRRADDERLRAGRRRAARPGSPRSLATVAEDLRDCRPTVFFAVPRVWEKFQEAVVAKLADEHGLKRLLVGQYLGLGGHAIGAHGRPPVARRCGSRCRIRCSTGSSAPRSATSSVWTRPTS